MGAQRYQSGRCSITAPALTTQASSISVPWVPLSAAECAEIAGAAPDAPTQMQVHVTSEHLAIVTEHADLGTVADYLAGQRGNPKFQVCNSPSAAHSLQLAVQRQRTLSRCEGGLGSHTPSASMHAHP